MKGVLLPGNKQVVIADLPKPEAQAGEVLVRIKASAICRSDMSLYYGGDATVGGDAAKGFITGHEPAGIVEAVGAGVRMFGPGDRVAVYLAIGCGVCESCRQGFFQLCPRCRAQGSRPTAATPSISSYPNATFLLSPMRCRL